MKKVIVLATFCICLVSCAPSRISSGDTPEARRQSAREYLRIVPPEDLMRDMAEKVAETMPESARDDFKRAMIKDIDTKLLRDAMMNSMVRRFTLAEIDALNEFYSSTEGKSVMKKFGLYMADVMPVIQAETIKSLSIKRQQGSSLYNYPPLINPPLMDTSPPLINPPLMDMSPPLMNID